MESFLREGVDIQSLTAKTISLGDAHFFEDSTPPIHVRQHLDSAKESDKLQGMKWLIAMISKGRNVSEFFPDVVKNVVVKSVEVKKMVYLYLVHYADHDAACREIALLSINSFQKDMSGTNPLIRGLALRVMTSIRVSELIQLQLAAVRKCASDGSPYVRKCAAIALTKIYNSDPEQLDQLKLILEKLLQDSSTMVLGSSMTAFNEICPTSYEILHKAYRKLCHLLADMDEWTQIPTLDILSRYVRCHFMDPAPGVSAAVKLQAKQRSASAVKGTSIGHTIKRQVVRKAFYSDEEDEIDEEEVELDSSTNTISPAAYPTTSPFNRFTSSNPHPPITNTTSSSTANVNQTNELLLDIDHRLALRSSQPLLKSRNAGVVLSVCSLHYTCGSHNASITQQIGKSLVRILRDRREIQYVVLQTIQSMARERPHIFRMYLSDFFIKASDPIFNRLLKLDILTSLGTKENLNTILKELQVYIKHSNINFVVATIKAVGRLVDIDTSLVAEKCMNGLMHMVFCTHKLITVQEECIVVLRQIIQQYISSLLLNSTNASASTIITNTNTPTVSITKITDADKDKIEYIKRILKQLFKLLLSQDDSTQRYLLEPSRARGSIIWLLGEYSELCIEIIPDICRFLTRYYFQEKAESRLQLLNTIIKIAIKEHSAADENIQNLMTYIIELSRYDSNVDIHDKARSLTVVMGLIPTIENDGVEIPNLINEDALLELNNHVKGLILAPKLPPVTLLTSLDNDTTMSYNYGSMSSILGYYVKGYEPLPKWSTIPTDSRVRDPIKATSVGGEDDDEGWTVKKSFMSGTTGTTGEKSSMSAEYKYENNLKGFYDDQDNQSSSSSSSSSSSDDEDSSSNEDSDSDGDSSDSDNSDEESYEDSSSSSDDDDDSDEDHRKSKNKHKNTQRLIGNSSRPPAIRTTTPPLMTNNNNNNSNTIFNTTPNTTSNNNNTTTTIARAAIRKVQPSQNKLPSTHTMTGTSSGYGGSRQGSSSVTHDIFNQMNTELIPTKVSTTTHSIFANTNAVTIKSTSSPLISTQQTVGRPFMNTSPSLLDSPMQSISDSYTFQTQSQQQGGIQPSVTMYSSNVNNTGGYINIDYESSNNNNNSNTNSMLPLSLPSSSPLPSSSSTMSYGYTDLCTPHQHQNNSTTTTYANTMSPTMMSSVSPYANMGNIHVQPGIPMVINQSPYAAISDSNASIRGISTSSRMMINNPIAQSTYNPTPGTMTASSVLPPQQQQQQQPPLIQEALSEPKMILKPDMTGGLVVLLVYRYNSQAVAYNGAHCVYLIIQNQSDRIFRRVKISFPADLRCTKVEEIPQLFPQQELFIPLELVLHPYADKQVRVDIRSDLGSHIGIYIPYAHELIIPYKTMTPAEFDMLRKRLSGLHEIQKDISYTQWGYSHINPSVSLTPITGLNMIRSPDMNLSIIDSETYIMNKVLTWFNVHVVQGGGVQELKFAGVCKKGLSEEKVLITILADDKSGISTVKVNCEDPLLSTTLIDRITKNLSSTTK